MGGGRLQNALFSFKTAQPNLCGSDFPAKSFLCEYPIFGDNDKGIGLVHV